VNSSAALVDSHCHLADVRLRDDTAAIIARAQEAGVRTLISVGAIGPIDTDLLAVKIAEDHAGLYAAVGVHPHDAKNCSDYRMGQLRELARTSKVVAIGESGLDLHYMHSPRESQESSFRRHLQLAAEAGKPIVIHCRDAESRIAEIVREMGTPPRGGVIHCFTGDCAAASEFLDLGFHISFSGILTFKNAAVVRAAAKIVPDDRVLIETDAPYLTPEPYRGRRNEPAFVAHTLAVLAKVRNADQAHLAKQIGANAADLFGLERPAG